MSNFQELTEALLALKQGKVDAAVLDTRTIIVWLKNKPRARGARQALLHRALGMGVLENDSDWLDAINNAILELWDSKEFHAIFRKWFERDPDYDIPWFPNNHNGLTL